MIASDAISNGCRVTLKRLTRDIDNRIAVERLTNRRESVRNENRFGHESWMKFEVTNIESTIFYFVLLKKQINKNDDFSITSLL